MAEKTLLEWAEKQQPWARDALRRHALCVEPALSGADKAEIIARVRDHAGITAVTTPTCEPLTGEHLRGRKQKAPRTELCSLGPVQHLNRLAADQKLNFATNGITLIYGDNGSGKSGYARVTKKICRSLTTDDLLGNVFDSGAKGPAEVNIRYRLEGDSEVTEVAWVDGKSPPPPLSQISVFDTKNARLYVDQQNRIGFLPADISLLQRYGAHCSEMDAVFRREVAEIEKRVRVQLPGGYTSGGEIAKLLARLDFKATNDLPSVEDIEKMAEWTDVHATELQKLEVLLANDPSVLAARCRRAKSILETFSESISLIESKLSADVASQLERLHTNAAITAQAASLAADDRFSSHPLQGIGQPAWRLMYDYAKAYAGSLNPIQNNLPDDAGERCVLCLEPLTPEAAERMKGFNDFVEDVASKAAEAARKELDEALVEIRSLQLTTAAQAKLALGEYGDLSEGRKAVAVEIVD